MKRQTQPQGLGVGGMGRAGMVEAESIRKPVARRLHGGLAVAL